MKKLLVIPFLLLILVVLNPALSPAQRASRNRRQQAVQGPVPSIKPYRERKCRQARYLDEIVDCPKTLSKVQAQALIQQFVDSAPKRVSIQWSKGFELRMLYSYNEEFVAKYPEFKLLLSEEQARDLQYRSLFYDIKGILWTNPAFPREDGMIRKWTQRVGDDNVGKGVEFTGTGRPLFGFLNSNIDGVPLANPVRMFVLPLPKKALRYPVVPGTENNVIALQVGRRQVLYGIYPCDIGHGPPDECIE